MANTATRLSANGSLTINGSFDEITRISANGLILYYDAGKSYPTGYGTTLNDLSSSNNTGILINSPVYTSANSGYFNLSGYNWSQVSQGLYQLPLKLDMQKFLQNGAQTIDVKTEHSSHSLAGEEALSLKVIQNLRDALSPF